MTIRIKWATSEHNVIHWIFEDYWNFDELQQATAESEKLFYSVDHVVHSIIEFMPGTKFPGNIVNTIRRAFSDQSFAHPNHPNNGIQYLVAPPYFAVTLIEIIGKAYPKLKDLFRIVPTVDVALDEIQALSAEAEVPDDRKAADKRLTSDE